MLERITGYILKSRLHAIGVAFLCALPSVITGKHEVIVAAIVGLLSAASIVIAAFITLQKGFLEGLCVALAATLPVLIGDIESLPNFSLSAADLMLILLVSNVLTWIYAEVLRRYASWSILLEVSALICIIAVVLVHIIYPDIDNWWEMRLTSYFANIMQMMGQLNLGDVQAETAEVNQLVVSAKPYITGVLVSFVALNALMQVLLARAWQSSLFSPGSLRSELCAIRLSYIAAVVFVVGLIWSLWGSDGVTDVVPVLSFTFGLAGLSVLHSVLANTKLAWLWLSLSYLLIIIMGMMPLAILALLDTGLDFRHRAKKFIGF